MEKENKDLLIEFLSISMVSNTYLFPNGMVCTFGYDDEQIFELQGRYSSELLAEIKKRSDDRTKWHGF